HLISAIRVITRRSIQVLFEKYCSAVFNGPNMCEVAAENFARRAHAPAVMTQDDHRVALRNHLFRVESNRFLHVVHDYKEFSDVPRSLSLPAKRNRLN